jgi:DNA end-binding protein Ku
MAHAIWSGTINFGLVTIPVKLFTAVRTNDLRFNFLHKRDEGRINNIRRCSVCGEEVAFADLVRGFEYEKGNYVIVTDDDFKRVNIEATQSVDIMEFVELDKIDPMFFDTPYYLEPEKKGRHAYALLRESLREANKVGIARVVIRSREHLAALKPSGEALVLELMHYADEIVDQSDFDFPALKEDVAPAELKVAKLLIDSMSSATFEPERFHDKYKEEIMAMIEARAAGKDLPVAASKAPKVSNVINIMDMLQRSLEERASGTATKAAAKKSAGVKKTAAEKPAVKPKRKTA